MATQSPPTNTSPWPVGGGAGATSAVVALTCWAALGAGLVVIAALRQRRPGRT